MTSTALFLIVMSIVPVAVMSWIYHHNKGAALLLVLLLPLVWALV